MKSIVSKYFVLLSVFVVTFIEILSIYPCYSATQLGLITGIVRDNDNYKPIEWVYIYTNEEAGVFSDMDGRYILYQELGKWTLFAEADGYEVYVEEVTVEEGEILYLDIELYPQIVNTTTSSSTTTIATDATTTTTVSVSTTTTIVPGATTTTAGVTTTVAPGGCSDAYPIDCGNGRCCPLDLPICGYGSFEGFCFKEDGSITTTVGVCLTEQIYGEHSEETELLRYLRDNVLAQTPAGQELIKLYYQWNPVIVQVVENDEEFKQDIKEMIDGVLEMIGGVE